MALPTGFKTVAGMLLDRSVVFFEAAQPNRKAQQISRKSRLLLKTYVNRIAGARLRMFRIDEAFPLQKFTCSQPGCTAWLKGPDRAIRNQLIHFYIHE